MTVLEQQRPLSSHSQMARAVSPIWLLGQLPKNLVSGSFMTLEGGFSLHELIRSCYFSWYFLSLGLLCSHRQNLKDERFALVHAAAGFPELKGTEGFPGTSV